MLLKNLSLTNYRAFTRLDMALPPRPLILVGANAQGKTSLLEAVYYLATFDSFHAQSDKQLINFLAAGESLAVARIVADFEEAPSAHRAKKRRIEVRLIQEGAGNGNTRLRKEILLDGVKRSANEAMGHFTAVIFLPQMTRIIEGGPEERRRYLNLAISQAAPGYAQALSEYSQALTQRNALLKQLNERGGDAEQLTYWDELLAQRAAILIHNRILAVDEIGQLATRIANQLTHSAEVLSLAYQPAYDPLPQPDGQISFKLTTTIQRSKIPIKEIQAGFLRRLQALRSEEIARGVTTIGPHRDELRFLSNGIDLGDYGSRGQVRTTLMALKLAEVQWLKDRTSHWPILLLDEILAELDIQRRADLLTYLHNCEQVLMTTTDLHLFPPEFIEAASVWNVHGGMVSEPNA
ncbi:MAG TPA: DNA replication and repair protein RecF [Anaerolineaceae bacterium]|nr:DNA replication and repair protein RecF [Anaerolineaceae bacterium]